MWVWAETEWVCEIHSFISQVILNLIRHKHCAPLELNLINLSQSRFQKRGFPLWRLKKWKNKNKQNKIKSEKLKIKTLSLSISFCTDFICACICVIDPVECHVKAKSGPCMAYIPRWYFNASWNNCTKFLYGGCQGNGNNFKSKKECEEKCLHVQQGESVANYVTLFSTILSKSQKLENSTVLSGLSPVYFCDGL